MKCTFCGKDNQPVSIFHNQDTGKSDKICASCMAVMESQQVKDLEEADRMLEEYQELSKSLESLIQKSPQIDGAESIPGAFTPLSMFKGIQTAIAELKSRRMELLTKEDGAFRLRYELKRAIEEEDYEKAEEIRKKLAVDTED